jgi:[ribosomal protein S5]-alanine N-acetyltransferase
VQNLRLFTTRLELVAATLELAQAEINNQPAFMRLLNVPSSANWPPPLNDEQSQRSFLASLEKAKPCDQGWNLWFCIRQEPRELLGNAGFKGTPHNGIAEIGYSMLEAHQRNGYCTEAVRTLIGWAFQHQTVQTVIAHTLPGLTSSIRVMEKCALVFAGPGPIEDGLQTIRYELPRARFQALASSRAGSIGER